jgi:predicted RNase H-like HicB family nuclease
MMRIQKLLGAFGLRRSGSIECLKLRVARRPDSFGTREVGRALRLNQHPEAKPVTDLWREAARLAARSYSAIVEQGRLASGTAMFMAYHPDLDGCMAQGTTEEEALAALDEVRLSFILRLLEQGQAVPPPRGHGVKVTFQPNGSVRAIEIVSQPEAEALRADLKQQAEQLAARPYQAATQPDEATDGNPIVIAWHPEFSVQTERGAIRCCLSDGLSRREALENLADARREFILSLLEDGLPAPEPSREIQVVTIYEPTDDS